MPEQEQEKEKEAERKPEDDDEYEEESARRIIETTLAFEQKAVAFVFVPDFDNTALRALIEAADYSVVQRLASPITPVPDPSYVEVQIMAMAMQVIDDPFMTKMEPYDPSASGRKPPWVEVLLETESVIITQSPPEQVSFRSLAKKATGAFIGAGLGYAAIGAVAAPPALLFLTVPAGMIICGAAVGVARGLETGLYHKLLQWFGVKPEEPPRRSRRSPPSRKKTEAS
jgi:hypothetical protein